MRFKITSDTEKYVVFSYEFENRLVYVGYCPIEQINAFGKHCRILDVEFQRRIGAPLEDRFFGEPEVICTILAHGLSNLEAKKFHAEMLVMLKPCWNVAYDPAYDKRLNKHVLHVERGIVFKSPAAAANATGIDPVRIYNTLNRPMFDGPKPGPKPTAHFVTTSRPYDHDIRYMNGSTLNDWRERNGYGDTDP